MNKSQTGLPLNMLGELIIGVIVFIAILGTMDRSVNDNDFFHTYATKDAALHITTLASVHGDANAVSFYGRPVAFSRQNDLLYTYQVSRDHTFSKYTSLVLPDYVDIRIDGDFGAVWYFTKRDNVIYVTREMLDEP